MVKKSASALALQPVATASSPARRSREGAQRFLSFRSEISRDTDPDRTGMLPLAFEPGMGFERYVDYALDVPMYFVERGETYIDVAGQSFRDLIAGGLAALPGERATISDSADHVSTIFPEVRFKRISKSRRRWWTVAAASPHCPRIGSAFSTTTLRSMPPGIW